VFVERQHAAVVEENFCPSAGRAKAVPGLERHVLDVARRLAGTVQLNIPVHD
jgi:hypothetical protein